MLMWVFINLWHCLVNGLKSILLFVNSEITINYLFANSVKCSNDGHYKVASKKMHKMQDFLVLMVNNFQL